MTIKIPHIIQTYVDSSNRHDVQSILPASQTMRLFMTREKRCMERTLDYHFAIERDKIVSLEIN